MFSVFSVVQNVWKSSVRYLCEPGGAMLGKIEVILHSSFFILHSSFFILHSSFFILNCSHIARLIILAITHIISAARRVHPTVRIQLVKTRREWARAVYPVAS